MLGKLFLATALLVAQAPAPQPPIPYNGLTNTIGDSRGAQDSFTGAASGAGGSVISFLGPWSEGRLRYSGETNAGIGGAKSFQIYAWPRYNGQASTASFVGSSTTITSIGGGGAAGVGVQVGASGITGIVLIDGTSTVNTTACATDTGSNCTGAGGTGTYHLNTAVGTLSSRSTQLYYRDTKTIAEMASGLASIIGMPGNGTNDSGATIQFTLDGVKGLTVPGWPYPGYRPNGEASDQPLPLYPCTAANTATCRGNPKVVLLVNEFRKGCDWQGGVQNNVADDAALENYANILSRLDFASSAREERVSSTHLPNGSATYLPGANPQVVVSDVRHRGGYIDTYSVPGRAPKCGFNPDGLHSAPTLSWFNARDFAQRLWPAIYKLPTYAVLQYTDTSDLSKILTSNGLMTGTSGTVSTATGIVASGQAPSSWIAQASGTDATWSLIGSINALGGNKGSEFCVRVTSNGGVPAAGGTLAITLGVPSTGSGGYKGYSTVVSTDKLRYSYRDRWSIASGKITSFAGHGIYNNSFIFGDAQASGGSYSTNNLMLFHGLAAYPNADTSHADLKTEVSIADFTGLGTGGIALTSLKVTNVIGWASGEPVDLTYCLANATLAVAN